MRRWPLALARWQEAGSGFRGSQATLRRGPGPRGSGSRQAHRGRVPRAVGQDGPRRQRPRSVRECEALRKPFLRPGALVPSYARYARASCGSWLVARGSWLVARARAPPTPLKSQVSSVKCGASPRAEADAADADAHCALFHQAAEAAASGDEAECNFSVLGSRRIRMPTSPWRPWTLDEGARWRGQLSG